MISNAQNDLSIIKQIIALQSMDENSLRNMWDKFFDYKPEVDSRISCLVLLNLKEK